MGNLTATAQKSAGECLGVGSFQGPPASACGRLRGAGTGCCCPHKPGGAGCGDATGAAGHRRGCRGEDGGNAGCGAAVGSHPAAGRGLKPARKCQPSTSTGPRHRQTRVCAPAAGSCPDARPLSRSGLSTGTTHQGHGPLVHPLPLLPKIPPSAPCLHQLRALSLLPLWHQPKTPFSTSMEKMPPALAPSPALPAGSWWDGRVGGKTGLRLARPSVRLSVRPAAALLWALTSALPAAGRWAGGTAPIVLKIIQRSTNSLQISVTVRRN